MHCELNPSIIYTEFTAVVRQQKEVGYIYTIILLLKITRNLLNFNYSIAIWKVFENIFSTSYFKIHSSLKLSFFFFFIKNYIKLLNSLSLNNPLHFTWAFITLNEKHSVKCERGSHSGTSLPKGFMKANLTGFKNFLGQSSFDRSYFWLPADRIPDLSIFL